MSHEQKVGFWEKTTSRRDFLKLSGKSMAGVTVSMTVLSLLTGCSKESADVSGIALATGVLISDSNRCTGCRRCETTCTMNNDGKADPNIARVKVNRNYNYGPGGPKSDYLNGSGHYGNLEIIPDTCQQCEDPACVKACPVQAISAQEKTGTRVVDESKCVGCGMCVSQCPFKMITVDEETKKSKKCFLCNGDPSCAKICPTGALKLVPWEEVYAVIQQNRHLFA